MLNFAKKNLVNTLVVAFLVIALPILLYLVSQTQVFKPRALGENSTLSIIGSTGGFNTGNPPSTTSQNVTVRLTYASSGTTQTPQPTATPNNCSNTQVSVTPQSVARGATLTVTASGLAPNSGVILTAIGPGGEFPAPFQANSTGRLTATLQFSQSDPVGLYRLTLEGVCAGSPVSDETTFTVI